MTLPHTNPSRWLHQTSFFDPDDPTQGNCTQAAVASILGLALEQVPNFNADYVDPPTFWTAVESFCLSQGYYLHQDDAKARPPVFYLALGLTVRETRHMVVMFGDKLIHDPHPTSVGLLSVENIFLLTPIDPILINGKVYSGIQKGS